MAKHIDKTQEEWDALIDKWHTDDIKPELKELEQAIKSFLVDEPEKNA